MELQGANILTSWFCAEKRHRGFTLVYRDEKYLGCCETEVEHIDTRFYEKDVTDVPRSFLCALQKCKTLLAVGPDEMLLPIYETRTATEKPDSLFKKRTMTVSFNRVVKKPKVEPLA